MVLNAFKDGETVLNETNLNQLFSLQNFRLIYEGSSFFDSVGGGSVENSIASYSYCLPFMILSDATELSRVELELDKDGVGADLIVQVRQGMSPATGVEGTTLKQVAVPKEFIPTTKKWLSIPIGLTGLVGYGLYYLVILRSGDASNKIDWLGESVQNPDITCYCRTGSSGAWSVMPAPLHAIMYAGESGDLKHGIYGENGYTTVEYDVNGQVSKVYRYLPPADGPTGGVRDIQTYIWAGEYLKSGVVG